MASLKDIFNNRVKKPISNILGNVRAIANPQTRQDWFRGIPQPVQNYAQSFASNAQAMGRGVGGAIRSPFDLYYNNKNAQIDQRLGDTLRNQQARFVQQGNQIAARDRANKLAAVQQATANRQTGMGQQMERDRLDAALGTVGTLLQLYGAKGITPASFAGNTALTGGFGYGVNRLFGGSHQDALNSAGSAAGNALQYKGTNKLTDKFLLDPLLRGVAKTNPLAKFLPGVAKSNLPVRIGVGAGANALVNMGEDELLTRVNERRAPTMEERYTSGGIGTVMGGLSGANPEMKNLLSRIFKTKGKSRLQPKSSKTTVPMGDGKQPRDVKGRFSVWTKSLGLNADERTIKVLTSFVNAKRDLTNLSGRKRTEFYGWLSDVSKGDQITQDEILQAIKKTPLPEWTPKPDGTGITRSGYAPELAGLAVGAEPEYDENGRIIGIKMTDDPKRQLLAAGLIGGKQALKGTPNFSSLLDKKPRFEIDDSGAKLKGGKVVDEALQKLRQGYDAWDNPVPLSEVLDHPQLYKNYPELKGYKVQIGGISGSNGQFDPATKTIKIANDGRWETGDAKSTLLHEIQHAIQQKEGFARGGSPMQFIGKDPLPKGVKPTAFQDYKRLSGELEARAVQRRMDLTPAQRASTDPYAAEAIATVGKADPSQFITRFDSGKSSLVDQSGKFAEPYKRGDIATLQKQLDDLLGTNSFNSTGKWNAQLPARQTAIRQLEEYANQGEKEAIDILAKVRSLEDSIGTATVSKNTPIPTKPPLTDFQKSLEAPPREIVQKNFGKDPAVKGKKLSDVFNQTSTRGDIRVDEEAQAQGLGNLLDETGKMNTSVKNTFGDWVKARQASKVQDSIKKRQFSQFDSEGINGINRFQSGEKEGLESVTKYFDDKFKELQKANVKFNYQEDYVPQLWKNAPEEVLDVMGKRLGLKPSFTLDKVIEDYKKGIKLGLTPKFTKLSELVGWYEGRANKALADTSFFNTLVKDELIKPSSKAKGWVTLDPDRFPKFKSGYEDTEYQGTYSAPKELADLVNNYLKQPEGILATIANYASQVKNTLLSAGIPGTGLNAHGLNILVRNTMASNNPVGGFLRGTEYLIAPARAEKWVNKNLDKVEFAAKSGVTFNIEDHNFEGLEDTIRKERKGILGAAGRVWNAAMERREKLFDKPLFEKAIPALKVQYFDNLYTSLKKEVNEKDAARTASEITNNIFGGINSEAMGRSREFQNLLRATILAPDWAETQIQLGKNIPKSIWNFKNPAGKAYRTFARNMVLAYISANVANKLSSGHYMWENEAGHTFEIEASYTEDGKKRYLRPFGTALDMVRIPYDVALSVAKGDVSSIGRVVRNRLSVPLSNVAEVVTNVDYRGRKVFGSDVPTSQQLGSIATIAGESAGVPSQFGSIMGGVSGKTGAEETLSNLLELPFRYTGGAASKTQKFAEDTINSSGLSGKEKYDTYAKLKGQTLGDKQKRAIELGGNSALNTILKKKELDKKQTDLRKKYSGEEEEKGLLEDIFGGLKVKKVGAADNFQETTTSNALQAGTPTSAPKVTAGKKGGLRGIFSKLTSSKEEEPVVPTIKPGELKSLSKFESDDIKLRQEFGEPVTNDELTSYYLGAIPSSKSKSAYDTTVRQKALFKALDTVQGDDMLSEEQRSVVRERIAKETGLEQKDLDYYEVASQDNDLKYQKVLDDSASLESRDALFKYLAEGRKVVNGKLLVTDDVIQQLYEDEYLDKYEREYLQALRWNKQDKKVFLDRDFKAKGSGKGGTGKKKKAAYFNALEGVLKAQGQLQTASRLQPISLGKSNFETVLSNSRASSPGKSGKSLESIFSQLEASKKSLRNLRYAPRS